MGRFEAIRRALEYMDSHLDETLGVESLAQRFHFSAYYFHRMFSLVVGKPLAAYLRDRRLLRACALLAQSDQSVLQIGMDCGYASAQSFSRAFKAAYGLSPRAYRRQGLAPTGITVEAMIMGFTNRLRGGMEVNPKMIQHKALVIAGVSGDGGKTAQVWEAFMALHQSRPLENALSQNGYEVRLYGEELCTVHVGLSVPRGPVDPAYTLLRLPAGSYAVFDVYVAQGYDSENAAMNEWLASNAEGYTERLLEGAHFCVEYYDERFHSSEAGSIVEIWVPVEKKG